MKRHESRKYRKLKAQLVEMEQERYEMTGYRIDRVLLPLRYGGGWMKPEWRHVLRAAWANIREEKDEPLTERIRFAWMMVWRYLMRKLRKH